MYQLVYISSAAPPFTEIDLTRLLEESRINNQKRGITGVLVYLEGNILQILEGEKAALDLLFPKIQADPRHKGVIKMIFREVPQRDFPNWKMAYRKLSHEEWNSLDEAFDLQDLAQQIQVQETTSRGIHLLKKFLFNNARA